MLFLVSARKKWIQFILPHLLFPSTIRRLHYYVRKPNLINSAVFDVLYHASEKTANQNAGKPLW